MYIDLQTLKIPSSNQMNTNFLNESCVKCLKTQSHQIYLLIRFKPIHTKLYLNDQVHHYMLISVSHIDGVLILIFVLCVVTFGHPIIYLLIHWIILVIFFWLNICPYHWIAPKKNTSPHTHKNIHLSSSLAVGCSTMIQVVNWLLEKWKQQISINFHIVNLIS